LKPYSAFLKQMIRFRECGVHSKSSKHNSGET
jgi:hypothetical protein